MYRKNSLLSENVERDPRLFMWFLTLVLGVMYAFALFQRPELRQSWQFFAFTGLMVVHVILHWQIEKIIFCNENHLPLFDCAGNPRVRYQLDDRLRKPLFSQYLWRYWERLLECWV